MSTTDKLIVVLGATGLQVGRAFKMVESCTDGIVQGASVVDTFLEIPGWKVRGVTRNPAGANAQNLARAGVELVQGNWENAADLARAFTGSFAVRLAGLLLVHRSDIHE